MDLAIFLLLTVMTSVHGAYIGAPGTLQYPAAPIGYAGHYSPALVSQDSNIIRSYGNLGQVATFGKKISTPYSSVQKSEVRVSNDALAYPAVHHPASVAYASPPVHHATPVAYPVPAPVREMEPHGMASPAIFPASTTYHQPAPMYHHQPAPMYHHQPTAYAQPSRLIGVAYSAAPVVSHMTYSNGYGVSYGY